MKTQGVPSLVRRLEALLSNGYPHARSKLLCTLTRADGKSSDQIRVAVNLIARAHIAEMKLNTIDIRILLDDYDNLEYWYMNFATKVLPFWEQNS